MTFTHRTLLKAVVCWALLSNLALAQVFPTSGSSSGGGSAFRGLGIHASLALKGAMGTAADGKEDVVESRSMFNYGAEANLGLRLGRLVAGASVDYIIWEQREDASEVGDTDMSGTQINLSPMVGFAVGPFMLQAKTPFKSTMSLKEKDASGNKVEYTDQVFPALNLQVKYRLGGKTFIGLEYTKTTYETMDVDGEENKLDADTEVTYSSWGLVYGINF